MSLSWKLLMLAVVTSAAASLLPGCGGSKKDPAATQAADHAKAGDQDKTADAAAATIGEESPETPTSPAERETKINQDFEKRVMTTPEEPEDPMTPQERAEAAAKKAKGN